MTSNKHDSHEQSNARRRAIKGESRRFFEEQLTGEEALTFATAKHLFGLAKETSIVEPWQILGDSELVLVKDTQSKELCYCSAMGRLGEVIAIHAYLDMESYRLFKKIASGTQIDSGEFFGSQRSVSVEFLPPSQLSPPDRELALAFGHALKRGLMAPQFRAGRPGYRPWYPTETEGKVLALCVESVLAFCEYLAENPSADFWDIEDVYPEVKWKNKKYFRVENTLARVAPPPPLHHAILDQERLDRLAHGNYPVRQTVELDQFYSGAPIGEKNQRKACLRVVMSADAQSAFLYTVDALEPTRSAAEALVEGVLKTIEGGKFVPAEIRVRDEAHRVLLLPLKDRFGFELCVVEKLPALEFAKKEMGKAIGI